MPLTHDGVIALLEFVQGGHGKFEFGWPQGREHCLADRGTVVKLMIEPILDPVFHPDSYGYRPGKSAKQAIAVTRKRCWQYGWVVEFDIQAAFDQIDHALLLRKGGAKPHQGRLDPAVHRAVADCAVRNGGRGQCAPHPWYAAGRGGQSDPDESVHGIMLSIAG
ncbi:reverse transcriptase domain-containing protein [Cupriavidus necator]|uniref:reverse transcriptase domain-containing protein n=1 Tax=Cupriavidus necator TaxID=106590 RepID=UPI003ED04FFC